MTTTGTGRFSGIGSASFGDKDDKIPKGNHIVQLTGCKYHKSENPQKNVGKSWVIPQLRILDTDTPRDAMGANNMGRVCSQLFEFGTTYFEANMKELIDAFFSPEARTAWAAWASTPDPATGVIPVPAAAEKVPVLGADKKPIVIDGAPLLKEKDDHSKLLEALCDPVGSAMIIQADPICLVNADVRPRKAKDGEVAPPGVTLYSKDPIARYRLATPEGWAAITATPEAPGGRPLPAPASRA